MKMHTPAERDAYLELANLRGRWADRAAMHAEQRALLTPDACADTQRSASPPPSPNANRSDQ